MDEQHFIQQQAGKNLPYKVPENYFNQLNDEVMEKVATSVLYTENQKIKTPFLNPKSSYFDALYDETIQKITGEHLSIASKQLPYQLPHSYFEHLEQTVKAVTHTETKLTKIASFSFVRIVCSSAAVFIVLLVSQFVFNNGNHQASSRTTIANHKVESLNDEDLNNLITDDHLLHYSLHEEEMALEDNIQSVTPLIDEKDIQNYLQEENDFGLKQNMKNAD